MTSLFLSHASEDHELASRLRQLLQDNGLVVWMDRYEARAGDALKPLIEEQIANAEALLLLVSMDALASDWVRREINHGKACEKRIVPVRLPKIQPNHVALLLGEDVVSPELNPDHLEPIVNQILGALGKAPLLGNDDTAAPAEVPVSELELGFREPKLTLAEGKTNLTARATVTWKPPEGEPVYGRSFDYLAPIGKIEIDELRWYLERYYIWPAGLSKQRAQRLEDQLPFWGQSLMKAMLDRDESRKAHTAWENSGGDRRISVNVENLGSPPQFGKSRGPSRGGGASPGKGQRPLPGLPPRRRGEPQPRRQALPGGRPSPTSRANG